MKTIVRKLGRVRASLSALTLTASIVTLNHVLAGAAHAQDAGTIGEKIEAAAVQLATFGRPIAILAITLIFLAWVAEPMMPDWARENRGAIGKVLFAAIVIGLAGDLVDFFIT